jgi:hypothetical protein
MVVGDGAKELELNGQGHQDMDANFGIGSGTAFKSSGPASIVGTVYFSDPLTRCGPLHEISGRLDQQHHNHWRNQATS